jgi:hypothetical protein
MPVLSGREGGANRLAADPILAKLGTHTDGPIVRRALVAGRRRLACAPAAARVSRLFAGGSRLRLALGGPVGAAWARQGNLDLRGQPEHERAARC